MFACWGKKMFSARRNGYANLNESGIEDDWVLLDYEDFFRPEKYKFTPELKNCSNILTDDFCSDLVPFLPTRARTSPWHLIYSTSLHGYGLRNLYQETFALESPSLLVLKDSQNHVFGSITSCAPKISKVFCGNGESSVFSCSPNFKVYQWSLGNNYNIFKGSPDWMAFGCGSGTFALWLDSDLYHGRTDACETFQSKALCTCGDFLIKSLEVWTFQL